MPVPCAKIAGVSCRAATEPPSPIGGGGGGGSVAGQCPRRLTIGQTHGANDIGEDRREGVRQPSLPYVRTPLKLGGGMWRSEMS
jgi:hypothetical protein